MSADEEPKDEQKKKVLSLLDSGRCGINLMEERELLKVDAIMV